MISFIFRKIFSFLIWPIKVCMRIYRDIKYFIGLEDKKRSDILNLIPIVMGVAAVVTLVCYMFYFLINTGYKEQFARLKEIGISEYVNNAGEFNIPGAVTIMVHPISLFLIGVLIIVCLGIAVVRFFKSETTGKKVLLCLIGIPVLVIALPMIPVIVLLLLYEASIIKIDVDSGFATGLQKYVDTYRGAVGFITEKLDFRGISMSGEEILFFAAVALFVIFLVILWRSNGSSEMTGSTVYYGAAYLIMLPGFSWVMVNMATVVAFIAFLVIGLVMMIFAGAGLSSGGASSSDLKKQEISRLEKQNAQYSKNITEKVKGSWGYGNIDIKANQRAIEKNDEKIANLKKDN